MSLEKLKQIKALYAELLTKLPDTAIRDCMIKAVGTSTQLMMLSSAELDLLIDRMSQLSWKHGKEKK